MFSSITLDFFLLFGFLGFFGFLLFLFFEAVNFISAVVVPDLVGLVLVGVEVVYVEVLPSGDVLANIWDNGFRGLDIVSQIHNVHLFCDEVVGYCQLHLVFVSR